MNGSILTALERGAALCTGALFSHFKKSTLIEYVFFPLVILEPDALYVMITILFAGYSSVIYHILDNLHRRATTFFLYPVTGFEFANHFQRFFDSNLLTYKGPLPFSRSLYALKNDSWLFLFYRF